MRAVLDTNIWLDWLAFEDPGVAFIDQAHAAGLLDIAIDEACEAEFKRVLGYTFGKKKLTKAMRDACLRGFRRIGSRFHPGNERKKLPKCSDPDDQKFLELGSASNADVLVSKDQALLDLAHRGLPLRIADPRQFSAVLLEKALAPRTLTFPSKKSPASFALEYEFGRFFVRHAERASLEEAVRRLATACKGVERGERRQPLHAIAVVPDLGDLDGAAQFGRELIWRFVREAGAYLYILDPAELCRLVRSAVDLSRLEGRLVVPSAMVAFDFLLLERFNRAGEMPFASFPAR